MLTKLICYMLLRVPNWHKQSSNCFWVLIITFAHTHTCTDANVLQNEVSNSDSSNVKTSGGDLLKEAVGTRNGCASPEVLVNGSPSPDIVDTIGGGGSGFANIEEIQFVGIVGPQDQKRICKIKCLNGVWVGPLCALEHGK